MIYKQISARFILYGFQKKIKIIVKYLRFYLAVRKNITIFESTIRDKPTGSKNKTR
jgi:hypothetical protein